MLILSAFLSVVGTVMPYEPLHQKYRPQTFADLVGQSAIGDTLSNAIERQRIAPAYLFSGPRGTGKTSSARILAKSLNCINSKQPTAQPCNQCEVCRSIVNGSALDIVEIDAASNTGVDNIREIIDRSSFAPVKCRYKLYVIDECLTGDSLIQTSAGVMRIDNPDLEGKKVLSYNETTQRWEEKKVLRWLNQGVKPIVKIKTTHRELRCTENHLIRTDQGWIKAKNLKAGIKILSPVNVDVEHSSINTEQIGNFAASSEDISLRAINTEKNLTTSQRFSSKQNLYVPSVPADVIKNFLFRLFYKKKAKESRVLNLIGKDILTQKVMESGISVLDALWIHLTTYPQNSWDLFTELYWEMGVLTTQMPLVDFQDYIGHTVLYKGNGWNTKLVACQNYNLNYKQNLIEDMVNSLLFVEQFVILNYNLFMKKCGQIKNINPFHGIGCNLLHQKDWLGGTWMMGLLRLLLKVVPQSNFIPKAFLRKKMKLLLSGFPKSGIQLLTNSISARRQVRDITTYRWEQNRLENGYSISNNFQFPQWSTNLEKVESVHRVGKESVYDLEVEQNHNFVANGLLVHNCHMLSTAAFNALLKTLEEPPPRVVFVLATTDPQRVIPTIISRCQRFDFQRIPLSAMIAHLRYIAQKEQIEITEEALTVIAQVSHGGLRDAQSLLDQLSLLSGEISLDRVWDLVGAIPEQDLIALLQAIKQENGEQILTLSRQLLDRGREPIIVLESLAGLYRDLLIAKTAPQRSELVALTASTWEQICKLAQDWEVREILAGQKHLQKSEAQVKQTTQPRLWLEVTLLGLLAVNQPSTETSPLVKTVSLPQTASKDEPKPTPPPKPEQPSPPSEVPKTTAVKSESETTTAPSETPDTANVVQIWTQMLERLPPPTKPLVKDHCSLLAIEGNIAVVGVRNQHLFPFAKKRQKDLEQALTAILKRDITVKLEVKGEQKFQSAASPVSTPEKKTDNPLPPPPQENRKPSPVVEEVKKEPEVTETTSISTPDVSETNQNEETATDSTVDVSDVPETNQNEETETDEKTLKKAAKDLADVFKGEIIEFNQSDG